MLAILCLSLSAQANVLPTSLVLYDGDVRVLKAPGVERVAVGNVDLISATLLKNEEVVLTAQQDGETTVLVWFEDGTREQMSVVVAKGNGYRQMPELRAMLSGIPGARLRTARWRSAVRTSDGQRPSRRSAASSQQETGNAETPHASLSESCAIVIGRAGTTVEMACLYTIWVTVFLSRTTY